MAAEKQTTNGNGREGQKHSPTRGTLESDCAVFDVPASSTTSRGFDCHANGGDIRQNLGLMDVSDDEVEVDQKSTAVELREDLTQSNPCMTLSSTSSPTAAGCNGLPFCLTAGSCGTEQLETDVRRLRVEDGLDAADDENGDT